MDLRIFDRLPPELPAAEEAVRRRQDQGDWRLLRVRAAGGPGSRETGLVRPGQGGGDDIVELADVGVARPGGGKDLGAVHP